MELGYVFAPHDGEAGLGYYRRLAASNALLNWKELARMAEVPASRAGVVGHPEYMAQALGLDPAWTASAFQQEQRAREWRGLHRKTHDAVCPHCLKEAAYLRREWEHAYMVACQKHRVVLLDRCPHCSELLSSARQHLEYCQCGHDLRELPVASATPAQIWLADLIAGNGSSSLGTQPALHAVDLNRLCKLVKTLCLLSDPALAPTKGKGSVPPTIALATQFLRPFDPLLADWPRGFEQHVQERIEAGKPGARTLNALLGPWYTQLKLTAAHTPALAPFLQAVARVAAVSFDGVLGLDGLLEASPDAADHLLLNQAAKTLGIGRGYLLAAMEAGKLQYRARRFGTRGLVYEIPLAEVQRIAQERNRWTSESRACDALGVSPSVLSQMCAADLIVSDPAWRNELLKGGPCQQDSIEQLIATLKRHVRKARADEETICLRDLTSRRMGDKQAIQAALKAIHSGEIRAISNADKVGGLSYLLADVRKYFGTPVLEAGMSVHQLAQLTGWKWESISHWLDEGLMACEQITLRGQPCRVVAPQHLLEFSRTYLPLADLAKLLGSKSSALTDQLRGIEILGAKPLPNGSSRGGLLRLTDIARLAVATSHHLNKFESLGMSV